MDSRKISMVTFPPEAIVDFLAAKKTGRDVKGYELLLALLLHQFVEMQFGRPCQIGFELKEKYLKKGIVQGTASLTEIETILSEQVRQDSDIDIGITCGTGAVAFQLKRFGKKKATTGKELAEYINNLRLEYGTRPREAKIVLVLENDGVLDIEEMLESLRMTDFPFRAVMFISLDSRTNHLWIGEFWPQRGSDEFTIENGRLRKLPA